MSNVSEELYKSDFSTVGSNQDFLLIFVVVVVVVVVFTLDVLLKRQQRFSFVYDHA
jgi:hypothetical protein